MNRVYTYTAAIEPAENGYIVSVPALPGCLTQGDTFEDAVRMAKEAIVCYLEGLVSLGKTIPVEQSNAAEVRLDVSLPAFA